MAAIGAGNVSAQKSATEKFDSKMFPFAIHWDDASKTAIDCSSLNSTPAGGSGFVQAKEGHFFDEKGKRVRLFGVNVGADAAFPTHADAEKIAAHMHKFGINAVRLHHTDTDWAKISVFDRSFDDTQHFNKEAIDKLDYFIFQLKKNGVYINLNLKSLGLSKKGTGFLIRRNWDTPANQ